MRFTKHLALNCFDAASIEVLADFIYNYLAC
jgi:hypothetical protein